jgi:hypothetical protein
MVGFGHTVFSKIASSTVFGGLKHLLAIRPRGNHIQKEIHENKKHAVCLKLQTIEFSQVPKLSSCN